MKHPFKMKLPQNASRVCLWLTFPMFGPVLGLKDPVFPLKHLNEIITVQSNHGI